MNEEQTSVATHDEPGKPPVCEQVKPCRELAAIFREYAREKPAVVALWCVGIGFVLGWKLKPW